MYKHERLMQATLKLVLAGGYANLSMKALSREAQVAVGTIYAHFSSKEQLLAALYDTLTERLYARVLVGCTEGGDFTATFWQLTHNLLDYYASYPDSFSFLQLYGSSPLLLARVRRRHPKRLAPIRAILAAARRQHLVKDLPEPLLLALVIGPINAFMTAALAGQLDAQDRTLRRHLQQACWQSIAC